MRIRNLCALFLSIVIIFHSGCDADNRNERENGEPPTLPEDTVIQVPEEKKTVTENDIVLQKALQYDQYTLDDVYPYQDTVRRFQWEKIKREIARLENAVAEGGSWGVLSNYKNKNGEAPTIKDFVRNDYGRVSDQYGVERYQSVPLYGREGDTTLVRYGRDGWLVKINGSDTTDFLSVTGVSMEGTYLLPRKYLISWGDSIRFDKVVAVDVTNQNITMLEKNDETWHILSMNPATSGVHKPPHAHETPVGIFAIQEKKEKMYYVKDGTSQIAGYAPYASRFTNGAYIHGVPVQNPRKNIIEYSPSLGTTPRSHMCVRNASSHAKFVYDRATVRESVVIVID